MPLFDVFSGVKSLRKKNFYIIISKIVKNMLTMCIGYYKLYIQVNISRYTGVSAMYK